MRYFDAFAGIGGFALGIGDSAECVGFCEINKHAIAIYRNHFPRHTNYGDITTIRTTDLPDFDLLCGGFPCQTFSLAGTRRGFADARGTLFFELARLAQDKRPRLLFFENVKGLLSHDQGNTFGTILDTLDGVGYDLQWQLLNSKDFGVPQNRERVFIVGHLRGTPRPEVFPLRRSDRTAPETRITATPGTEGIATRHLDRNGGLISEIASTLQVAEVPHIIVKRPNVHQDYRVYDTGGIGSTLNANSSGGSAKHPFIQDGTIIRRLTPVECERLQGFPDNWTAVVSDSHRYKCLGNAVTVSVISAIADKLIKNQGARFP